MGITREEARALDEEYRRSLINFGILCNPMSNPIDKIYDDFEQQLKEAKDLRNNSVLISQDDVDFLQLQNQQYADTVAELEQQLANLNSNLEAQEIMIADYKKRIEELEAPKSCEGCKYGIFESKVKYVTVLDETLECCFVCTRACDDYYEPKDK